MTSSVSNKSSLDFNRFGHTPFHPRITDPIQGRGWGVAILLAASVFTETELSLRSGRVGVLWLAILRKKKFKSQEENSKFSALLRVN